MAVPARPVSGQPIATPWGGVVHDAIVAVDLQAGKTSLAFSTAQASKVVTFPRPFATPPIVVVSISNGVPTNSADYTARVDLVTATGFTLWFVASSAWGITLEASWFAMGPRT